ncbi:MAG: ABC transporter ATP-binding protein [Clostridia bacterium]|nr:ABC transporter ATP-binding protein [Clostridia bacterium]
MNKKGQLSPALLELLGSAGLDTSELIWSVTSDMDDEGCYCTAWITFDKKGLYIAFGSEETVPGRQGKKATTKYTLRQLRSFPADEVGKLKTESYLTTARLIGEKDGNEVAYTYFSVGLTEKINDLIKVWETVREGKDPSDVIKSFRKSDVCPTCGMRYPDPDRAVCPKCVDKSSTVKRLFSFFNGYWGKVAIIIATMLLGTAVTLLMPQISTKTLYDNVLNAGNPTPVDQLIVSLGYLVLAIIGVKLASQLLQVFYSYVTGAILPWVIYDIKLKIFNAMQRMSVGFYTAKQTGSLMERVTSDANNIYWFMLDGMSSLIVHAATIIGILVIMFIMSWQLTVIALVSLPIILGVYVALENVFHRLYHKNWARSASLSSMVSDNVNGQRVIKAFSKEDEESGRFADISGKLRDSDIECSNTEATAYPLISLFVYIASTVILAVGGIMVVKGRMTIGTLLTFVIYLNMLQMPLDTISWVSSWWARCFDSAHRVFEVIDTEPDVTEREDPVILENFRGSIDISELEFEYEPARPVIKKLDLHVKAGQMLGIVGKTGAGKSTIANLIARLYDPKAGVIKIDGVDVRDLSLSQLRENIGLVSQEIYLFMGTIADNIRYAKPDATMEEVIAAAKAASAHDFIMKLPDTYETRVGAGGQDLSGGERQRISIARTIIQNPRILILDEATAAMDTETERNIQESLTALKSGRTTLAIAHRLSTLRDADTLAVIEDGKVVEFGTYTELMYKKGEYYKLYQMQAEALKYVGIGED